MKFIVDVNVGRLAVWLRILGYDTVFINPIDDGELVEIAARESRIVLTKDGGIMRRRVVASGDVQALKIEGEDWKEQLRQVIRAYKLSKKSQFTRCIECNVPLAACAKGEVKAELPPVVFKTQDEFWHCSSCARYYWEGGHWRRMSRILDSIVHPM